MATSDEEINQMRARVDDARKELADLEAEVEKSARERENDVTAKRLADEYNDIQAKIARLKLAANPESAQVSAEEQAVPPRENTPEENTPEENTPAPEVSYPGFGDAEEAK